MVQPPEHPVGAQAYPEWVVACFGLVMWNMHLVARSTSVQDVTLPRLLVPYTQLQYVFLVFHLYFLWTLWHRLLLWISPLYGTLFQSVQDDRTHTRLMASSTITLRWIWNMMGMKSEEDDPLWDPTKPWRGEFPHFLNARDIIPENVGIIEWWGWVSCPLFWHPFTKKLGTLGNIWPNVDVNTMWLPPNNGLIYFMWVCILFCRDHH